MRNTFLGAILFFITLLPESTLAEAVDVDGGLTITISALPGFCNERARDVLELHATSVAEIQSARLEPSLR